MKTTGSNADVMHAWANQTTEHMRSGHVSFDRETLKSYAAIIGQHIKNKAGESAVLFSKRNYSVTTSGHQGRMRNAANHLRALYVPDIYSSYLDDKGRMQKRDVESTFAAWEREAGYIIDNLKRARKPAKYITELSELGNEVASFVQFVGVKAPAKLRKLLAVADREDYREAIAEQVKREKAREAKKHAEQIKANAIAIDAWRNFERDPNVTYRRVDRDYLRFNRDTDRIETSQSVQVPIKLARAMFYWLIKTRASGGCTDCDYTILDYRVRSVRNEFFEVGCHTIYFDEVENIARLLGWESTRMLAEAHADDAIARTREVTEPAESEVS